MAQHKPIYVTIDPTGGGPSIALDTPVTRADLAQWHRDNDPNPDPVPRPLGEAVYGPIASRQAFINTMVNAAHEAQALEIQASLQGRDPINDVYYCDPAARLTPDEARQMAELAPPAIINAWTRQQEVDKEEREIHDKDI